MRKVYVVILEATDAYYYPDREIAAVFSSKKRAVDYINHEFYNVHYVKEEDRWVWEPLCSKNGWFIIYIQEYRLNEVFLDRVLKGENNHA